MKVTNRAWQKHLRAKGVIAFFLDRLQSHALSSSHQHNTGPFCFPITNRETEDELTKAFFEFTESFPYEFYIELTNRCNLNCKMCVRGKMTRPLGTMSMKLFRRIVDEIVERQPYAYVHFYGIGESLLDKNIFRKLSYAHKRGLRNTIIFSNGQLMLDDDNYRQLVGTGVSTIGIDLDGFSKEAYERIRVGGEYKRAKRGIEKLYEYVRSQGLKTRIEIAYQIYAGVNDGDVDKFIEWCEKNDYEYKLVMMHTWAGLRKDIPVTKRPDGSDDDLHRTARHTPCCSLYAGLMILWDGRVALCFEDADGREILGDVRKDTIEHIWAGSHLKKRREHIKGLFKGLCASCDSLCGVQLPGFGSALYPKSWRHGATR